MSTLYIDHKGMDLAYQSGALVLRGPDPRPRSIPLALLERVVVQGDVNLSSSLLGRLAEANIGLVVLSGRQSWRTACLLGRPHRDLRIRLAQYQAALDAPAAAELAALWVRGKLRAQLRTLTSGRAARPEHGHPLRAACDSIAAALERLRSPLPLESLRGLEGGAAAIYFPAFARLFPPALGFSGRNRRPPRDPVNAALSLAYTLLHFEAVRSAQAAGLDPLLGTLHQPAYGRESLACDLIEPLRPRVDAWVWQLFRSRSLRDEHFLRDKGACLLHKAGRRHFYEAWETAACLYRLPLRGFCRLLVRRLRGLPLTLSPTAPDWDEFPLHEGRDPIEEQP